MHAGLILVGRYRLVRPLGSGAHGSVWHAEDLGRGGQDVAVKVIEGLVGSNGADPAECVLAWFRHPNWADVLDGGRCGEHDWFHVMRFVAGTSLAAFRDAQPAEVVWRFLEDGARVLRAIHRLGLIHYDVTPGNFLRDDTRGAPRFVLTDGGLAHIGPLTGVGRGTPLYMAPELTEDRNHDHRVDLYSLGLVAFRLATGRDPVQGGAGEVLGRRRREAAPRASTFRPDVPKALDDLLADLLAREPAQRPFDGGAVLQRIGAALGREVPDVLPEEAIAAAAGGPIVDREQAIGRFRQTVRALATHGTNPDGTRSAGRATPISDPVLLLSGSPGSGTTRLERELCSVARQEEIPVLLLSGRDGAPDPREPLRRLMEGAYALAGASLPDDGRHADVDLDAGQRAIERLVHAVETGSRATPFVLCVEHLADLPPVAQDGIRVLARHLLARSEHSPGPSQPAVVLVVDLGADDAKPFVLPDSADPRRPVLTVEPLPREALALLCESRFPSLKIDPADAETLERVSRGLPAVVVALLSEAVRRNDLRFESGRWAWALDRLHEYVVEAGLAPVQQDALRSASPALRRLLEHLALAENAVPAASVLDLWRDAGTGRIPDTALLATLQRGGATYYSLASLAVRQALLRQTPAERLPERRARVLAALDAQPDAVSLLDRARLRIELGRSADALSLLRRELSSLTRDDHLRIQRLLRESVESTPSLLSAPSSRTDLIQLLHQGPDATFVALRLAETAPHSPAALPDNLRLATVLDRLERIPDALALLHAQDETLGATQHLAELHVLRALYHFELRQPEAARASAHAAHPHMRIIARTRLDHLPLLATYLGLDAQVNFVARPRRSLRSLSLASRAARHCGMHSLRARFLSNQGIVLQRLGLLAESARAFSRSARIRAALGDARGLLSAKSNLAQLTAHRGIHLRAAALYSEAIALAIRHGYHTVLITTFRKLAELYDHQDSCRLALHTYRRALRTAEMVGARSLVSLISNEIAPLAAALGDLQEAHAALRASLHSARNERTPEARGEYSLAAGLAALFSGHPNRAAVYLRRAIRRSHHMPRSHMTARLLQPLADQLACESATTPQPMPPRPALGQTSRDLYRGQLLLRRGLRAASTTPLHPPRRMQTATGLPGRLLLEHALLLARRGATSLLAPLDGLRPRLERSGLRILVARCSALVCTQVSQTRAARAKAFSECVSIISDIPVALSDRRHAFPEEVQLAVAEMDRSYPAADSAPAQLQSLQATAYRVLTATKALSAADPRSSSALRKVLEAAARIRSGGGVDALLDSLTRHTIEVTGAHRACVVLLEGGSDLRIRIATSASQRSESVEVQDLSHTVIRRVILSKEPLLLHDVFDDHELLARPSILGMSLRSILCVPMLRGATLYGVMYADTDSAIGAFDRVDLELMTLFAEQAAAALEGVRLVEDLQKSYADLKALQERLVRGERLRVIGELSSGVAHEFNNLLTSILARVQMMSMGYLSPDMRRDLDLIEKAALDAAGVVRRLQSFSRQQRQADFVLVNMRDICADAIDFLRPLWRGSGRRDQCTVSVQLHCEEELPVRGDPTQLREIITNVLKNAVDAIPGAGSIVLTGASREGKVRIRIQDSGTGIAAEHLPKLFDPFFTTKGERGTGLGLCLSQQIAERHGGTIVVDSEWGKGTTVTLTLPSHEQSLNATIPNGAPRSAAASGAVSVVVVDDDVNVLRPLCAYLQRSGFQVVPAADGSAGLRAVQESAPDVVLSDIGMPGMDGIELCRRIRQLHEALPIILMSGWASEVDPSAVHSAGAMALLAKPFAMQQVTELLSSVARGNPKSEPEARRG